MAEAARAPICSRCSSSSPSPSSALSFFFSKRLFSSPSLHLGLRSPLCRARTFHPSHSARVIAPHRLNPVRCVVRRSGGDSAYSPLNSGFNFKDRPPREMVLLFPGRDHERWLIVMDDPGGEGATMQQIISCYVQTLAKVVGSEEEARKKIYDVSCETYFGFGCEIDQETAIKLEGLPGVLFVLPDSYVDAESMDYKIVLRSPERQRRVKPIPHRPQDKPRYSDRNRYVRRRENQQ